jgi:hypothetical protein
VEEKLPAIAFGEAGGKGIRGRREQVGAGVVREIAKRRGTVAYQAVFATIAQDMEKQLHPPRALRWPYWGVRALLERRKSMHSKILWLSMRERF